MRVESLEEARVHIAMLHERTAQLERMVQLHEEEHDTWLRTAAWKRWVFMLDGWSGHRLMHEPRWRPWRRWWRS